MSFIGKSPIAFSRHETTSNHMRYQIWGFTDESPEREVLLGTRSTSRLAIAAAELPFPGDMPTTVIDSETDETLWEATDA
jgi:hypothetical protein